MSDLDPLYEGREQTRVKHRILRDYLEKFAYKVGSTFKSITYVDCFSGPWNQISEEFKDCSFAIALEEFDIARRELAVRGVNLKVRYFFLEADKNSYKKLESFVAPIIAEGKEIIAANARLEDSIPKITSFIQQDRNSFPFIFIDPTGWTGFKMSVIAPLLRIQPSEVLINFMTGHIIRFAESTDVRYKNSFDELFGDPNFREGLNQLEKQDREDAIVKKYKDMVRKTGNFKYVLSAMVLMPEKERTHFHLIYATRNPEGLNVFKEAEKKAMEEMTKVRNDAVMRQRVQDEQMQLFGSDELPESRKYTELRNRYLGKAKDLAENELKTRQRIVYDELWEKTLEPYPMVFESDLKDWIKAWKKAGSISFEQMKAKQQVPHRGQNNILVWNL